VTADTPRGIQPHQPAPNSTATQGKPHPTTERLASATPAPKAELATEVRRNIYESNGKPATPSDSKAKSANGDGANGSAEGDKSLEESLKEDIVKINCHVCGNDCTRVRFHNSKATPKFDVCPRCYREAKFSSNWQRGDFFEMENKNYSIIPDREKPWTEDENLLLLEGLEMYDDDWSKIADYVSTRSREECILRFLQLEIEDPLMEPNPNEDMPPALAMSYMGEGRAPFSGLFTPTISYIAALASQTTPKIVAASCGKSLNETRLALTSQVESGASQTQKGKEKAASTGATESETKPDAMDVESALVPAKDVSSGDVGKVAAFAMASSRSATLASHEERSLTRMVHTAMNLQIDKLDLKLKQFSELEQMLKLERKDVERRRQSLFLERLDFQRRMKEVDDAFNRALTLSPQEGQKLVRDAVANSMSKGSLGTGKQMGVADVAPLGEGDAGFKQHSL